MDGDAGTAGARHPMCRCAHGGPAGSGSGLALAAWGDGDVDRARGAGGHGVPPCNRVRVGGDLSLRRRVGTRRRRAALLAGPSVDRLRCAGSPPAACVACVVG
jgi:hypothetical protein